MASPIIPEKPLACYPKAGDSTQPATPPEAQCTSASVLKTWVKEISEYDSTCNTKNVCPKGEERKPYIQQSVECRQILEVCRQRNETLPLIARNLGVMTDSAHLKPLAPHLGYNLDDLRSAEVMSKAAKGPELTDLMRTKRSLNIVYPASGSHMAPLEIVMSGVDRGLLDSARLTYTEIEAKAEGRVREYLRLMASPTQSMISNLQETTQVFDSGRETTFSFDYKEKPVQLVFATDRGGDLWARDEVVKDGDLVIFHDSVYNSPIDENDKPMDHFIKHLSGLTAKDGKKRFVLTENVWGNKCETSGKCTIDNNKFSTRLLSGFYGCGTTYYKPPTYSVKDGLLIEDPKSPLQKGHSHLGPHPINTSNAILLTIAK